MATVKCPLGNRGTPSHEWYDGEKSRIYCMGWEDKRTDAPLEACLNCPDHVSKAQDDLDKWRADHPLVCGFDTSDVPDMTSVVTLVYDKQIPVQKRLIYAEDLFEPVDHKVLMVSVGGRSGGKTMALYEALFRKRVELAPTINAVVVPCNVGDKLRVDAKTLPTGKLDLLDEDIPEYFSATVVSIRQNTKGWWIKFRVWAPWLEWIRDDECGPYEAGVEHFRYFTVPASAIGKTVFLDDGERRKDDQT